MPPRTQLLVLVQDHELEPLTDAEVTLESPDGEEWSLPYDRRLQRYVADDLQPGEYRLSASAGDDLRDDERTVSVSSGENYVQSTLGPEDMRYYEGARGERAFFRADESKALLFAQGPRARDTAREIVDEQGLSAEEVHPKREVSAAPTEGPVDVAEAAAEVEEPDDEVTLLVDLDDGEEASPAELEESASRVLVEAAGPPGREPAVTVARPMFRGGEGESVEGLTAELIVRFEPTVPESAVEALAAEHECEVLGPVPYADNGYLWRYLEGPSYDVLDVIESVGEADGVLYAEPNVAVQLSFQDASAGAEVPPRDFLYPEQAGLGVVAAEGGWRALAGVEPRLAYGSPDVTIAVADSGVDPTHADLTGPLTDGSPKLRASYDFVHERPQRPGDLTSDHGTKSASSAAASCDRGSLGVCGVAGNCGVVGLRVIERGITFDDIATSWLWAAGLHADSPLRDLPAPPTSGADVISNSWSPTSPIPLPNALDDALDRLTRDGRDGRGCVVCFSAGNFGYRQFSNRNRLAADPRTIAVGASVGPDPTNPCTSSQESPEGETHGLPAFVDTRTYFNPYGAEMDVVAPSHTSYAAATGELVDPVTAAVPADWGSMPGYPANATVLAADAAPGDDRVRVADASALTPGDAVVVGRPGSPDCEYRRVDAIHGDAVAVRPLDHGHPAGTSVAAGPDDYDESFGGTSHACPTVAGTAALVLSARPESTWREVRDVIRSAADPIDVGQANPDGEWFDRDGDGVPDFSLWYGHGRLNVRAAVETVAPVPVPAPEPGGQPSPGGPGSSGDVWAEVRRLDERLARQEELLQRIEERLAEVAPAGSQPTPAGQPPASGGQGRPASPPGERPAPAGGPSAGGEMPVTDALWPMGGQQAGGQPPGNRQTGGQPGGPPAGGEPTGGSATGTQFGGQPPGGRPPDERRFPAEHPVAEPPYRHPSEESSGSSEHRHR